MTFDKAFDLVVGAEGLLSIDPRDNGNWTGGRQNSGELMGTKYGISASTYGLALKSAGKTIKDLTLEDAKEIYKRDFWGILRCDELPEPCRYPLFSCGVNCGIKRSVRFFQQALGVIVDGIMGGATIKAANKANIEEVLDEFFVAWGDYYDKIVENNPTLSAYINGWHNRIKEVKRITMKEYFSCPSSYSD